MGDQDRVLHVCMEMSAANAKGDGLALPHTLISNDRFYVVAMVNEAADWVYRAGMQDHASVVRSARGANDG